MYLPLFLFQVSCDVNLNVKPLSNKQMHRISDVYDIEPQKATIKAHSSIYVTVSFQPPSMQVCTKGSSDICSDAKCHRGRKMPLDPKCHIITLGHFASKVTFCVKCNFVCTLYTMFFISNPHPPQETTTFNKK